MPKWNVCVLYDASKTIQVDADTEGEAMQKAMDIAENICLCHQCSDHIEIGDPIRAVDAFLDDD